MEILLTNDDGCGMPFLGFLLEYLEKLAAVEVLVPAEEQSWKSKSRCSNKRLKLSTLEYYGRRIHTLAGSPADCVNIGIYHFFKGKPDLVVAGLNIGRNSGLSFVLSSGTIGAAMEANIGGLPAVALSQDIDDGLFSRYRCCKELPDDVIANLRDQNRLWLPRVFEWLSSQPDFYRKPVTWTVNMPFRATGKTQIKSCPLAHSVYQSLYEREGDEFVRSDFGIIPDRRSDRDEALLSSGHIAVTAIDIRQIGERV